MDPPYLLVALVLPPLLLGLALFAAALRAMAARQREVILADERIAGTTGALTGGLREVVACGAEDRMGAVAGAHVDDAARATLSLARLTAVRTAALGISGWVPLLILLAAPWLVRNGVTAGAVLGAVTYVPQALQPALQGFVQGLDSSGLWLLVTVGRMAEVAEESAPEPARDATASLPGEPEADRPVARPGACRVELRGLTFAYAQSADPVIRDLNLLLRPGEHLAVVGPSGAGKSTLAALIAGVLEPQAGQVHLDDLPVRALVGRGEGLARFVERLGGYDAPLDPRRLSAGERQLIALASALLPALRLTPLDEATCHLDPLAEAVAEDAFARGPGTLIVVAHRIRSALRDDRVLVMDGTRVALGTHEQLMTASSLYRDLVGHWGAAGPSPDSGARPARPTAGAMARTGMAAVLRMTVAPRSPASNATSANSGSMNRCRRTSLRTPWTRRSGGALVQMTPPACRSSMRRNRSGVVEAISSSIRQSGSRALSSAVVATSSPSLESTSITTTSGRHDRARAMTSPLPSTTSMSSSRDTRAANAPRTRRRFSTRRTRINVAPTRLYAARISAHVRNSSSVPGKDGRGGRR
ncbi:ABC transporter ATP-binding protein [Streptomyces sp. NPDC006235]|uniref:ABC transporter ATP-binding protein n=1 Tax=Streptomyces sp. NPDC006235 TaxID=3156736 RepID=UPI0033A24B98